MTVIKLCGIAVLGLIAVVLLKGLRAEYAVFAAIITGIVLLGAVLSEFFSVMDYVEEMTALTGFSLYFEVILKAMGIGLISEVTADICRDNGAGAIASKVEFGAKMAILVLSLPILKKLLDLIAGFLT